MAKTAIRGVLAGVALLAVASVPAAARVRHHHHAYHRQWANLPAGATDPAKDAALIIDGETGRVLYSRNAAAPRHPASLTKLMTLYLLFDALKHRQLTLGSVMTASKHAASQPQTNLHMHAGETISVDTAIKAIVVRSANDVAVIIAETLGGTEAHFAQMMNEKARAFGMRDTFYHNASGLPDPLQITTADDLGILARHVAYDFPQYFHYFATPAFSFHGITYPTHDNLIGHYQGADGMKTGYVSASGFNLVSSVVRGNTHLIGVVMGGRTARRRDGEMMRLLDNSFAAIAQNPTLVAHATVPWQDVAQNAPSVVAGFDLGPADDAQPAANGEVDEDTAETESDEDDSAPAPIPAPQPAVVKPAPRPASPALARNAAPVPLPKPSPKPVMVAAYQPRAAKPVLRTAAIGEGDVGDPGMPTPRFGAHDWTIQIGAYADMTQARAQLAAYAEKSMDVLGQARRIVVPFQSSDGQLLYRARFGPFPEREARQVCQRLTARGQTCFAAVATR